MSCIVRQSYGIRENKYDHSDVVEMPDLLLFKHLDVFNISIFICEYV